MVQLSSPVNRQRQTPYSHRTIPAPEVLPRSHLSLFVTVTPFLSLFTTLHHHHPVVFILFLLLLRRHDHNASILYRTLLLLAMNFYYCPVLYSLGFSPLYHSIVTAVAATLRNIYTVTVLRTVLPLFTI